MTKISEMLGIPSSNKQIKKKGRPSIPAITISTEGDIPKKSLTKENYPDYIMEAREAYLQKQDIYNDLIQNTLDCVSRNGAFNPSLNLLSPLDESVSWKLVYYDFINSLQKYQIQLSDVDLPKLIDINKKLHSGFKRVFDEVYLEYSETINKLNPTLKTTINGKLSHLIGTLLAESGKNYELVCELEDIFRGILKEYAQYTTERRFGVGGVGMSIRNEYRTLSRPCAVITNNRFSEQSIRIFFAAAGKPDLYGLLLSENRNINLQSLDDQDAAKYVLNTQKSMESLHASKYTSKKSID